MMMEFLKALFTKPKFVTLLIGFAIALGAKLGIAEETIQLGCEIAMVILGVWLGFEIKATKDETTAGT